MDLHAHIKRREWHRHTRVAIPNTYQLAFFTDGSPSRQQEDKSSSHIIAHAQISGGSPTESDVRQPDAHSNFPVTVLVTSRTYTIFIHEPEAPAEDTDSPP